MVPVLPAKREHSKGGHIPNCTEVISNKSSQHCVNLIYREIYKPIGHKTVFVYPHHIVIKRLKCILTVYTSGQFHHLICHLIKGAFVFVFYVLLQQHYGIQLRFFLCKNFPVQMIFAGQHFFIYCIIYCGLRKLVVFFFNTAQRNVAK